MDPDVPNPTSTPDVTGAQLVAIVTAVVGLAVAFGLVDNGKAEAIIGAASVIIPSVIVLADAHIRQGRAIVAAQHVASGARTVSSFVEPGEAQDASPEDGVRGKPGLG